MQPLRNILSYPAASVVAGVGYSALNQHAGSDGVTFLPIAAAASIVALIHALALGLPAALALRHFGKLNLPNVLVGSFLIGALPVPLLLMLSRGPIGSLRETVLLVGGCGVLGLVAGFTWFCIAELSPNKSLERTRDR